jgi:hypothetical protein
MSRRNFLGDTYQLMADRYARLNAWEYLIWWNIRDTLMEAAMEAVLPIAQGETLSSAQEDALQEKIDNLLYNVEQMLDIAEFGSTHPSYLDPTTGYPDIDTILERIQNILQKMTSEEFESLSNERRDFCDAINSVIFFRALYEDGEITIDNRASMRP